MSPLFLEYGKQDCLKSTKNLIRWGSCMNLKRLAEKIAEVAKSENDVLKLMDLGVFHMPELAFVYECGKQIMLASDEVFGNEKPRWIREFDLGNGGPSDLVFKFENGHMLVIEFKIRATGSSYTRDMDKLSSLDGDITRVFCALVDSFTKDFMSDKIDGRIKAVDNYRLDGFEITSLLSGYDGFGFSTKQEWYDSDVTCVPCVWQIVQCS